MLMFAHCLKPSERLTLSIRIDIVYVGRSWSAQHMNDL